MLDKQEEELLRRILEKSPNPNAVYSYVPKDFGLDMPELFTRLSAHGILKPYGFQPIRYRLTDKGRQYFPAKAEEKKEKRKERKSNFTREILLLIIGGLIAEALRLLFQWLFH